MIALRKTLPVNRHTLQVEELNIEVLRKPIKTMRLRVCAPNGEVRVSVPKSVRNEVLQHFIVSKLGWIRAHQQLLSKLSPAIAVQYTEGEMHAVQGKQYPLALTECAGVQQVTLEENTLRMQVKPDSTMAQRKKLLHSWYRQQLQQHIPDLIAPYEQALQVSVNSFGIRQMKTRWGTCNTRRHHVLFNLELAKHPLECLEYVVAHELTHLRVAGHNKRFYALMDRVMPNWRERKILLNAQHG